MRWMGLRRGCLLLLLLLLLLNAGALLEPLFALQPPHFLRRVCDDGVNGKLPCTKSIVRKKRVVTEIGVRLHAEEELSFVSQLQRNNVLVHGACLLLHDSQGFRCTASHGVHSCRSHVVPWQWLPEGQRYRYVGRVAKKESKEKRCFFRASRNRLRLGAGDAEAARFQGHIATSLEPPKQCLGGGKRGNAHTQPLRDTDSKPGVDQSLIDVVVQRVR
jgi:hypothetical protein